MNKADKNKNKRDRYKNRSIKPNKDKYLNSEKRKCFEFGKTSHISQAKEIFKRVTHKS